MLIKMPEKRQPKIRTAWPTHLFQDDLIRRLNRLIETEPAAQAAVTRILNAEVEVGWALLNHPTLRVVDEHDIVRLSVLDFLNGLLDPNHRIRTVYLVKEGQPDELLGVEAEP